MINKVILILIILLLSSCSKKIEAESKIVDSPTGYLTNFQLTYFKNNLAALTREMYLADTSNGILHIIYYTDTTGFNEDSFKKYKMDSMAYKIVDVAYRNPITGKAPYAFLMFDLYFDVYNNIDTAFRLFNNYFYDHNDKLFCTIKN